MHDRTIDHDLNEAQINYRPWLILYDYFIIYVPGQSFGVYFCSTRTTQTT